MSGPSLVWRAGEMERDRTLVGEVLRDGIGSGWREAEGRGGGTVEVMVVGPVPFCSSL